MKKTNNPKTLKELYQDLQSVYTLIEIEQEALDICCENEKDCTHITLLIDMILDKFKITLEKLERII